MGHKMCKGVLVWGGHRELTADAKQTVDFIEVPLTAISEIWVGFARFSRKLHDITTLRSEKQSFRNGTLFFPDSLNAIKLYIVIIIFSTFFSHPTLQLSKTCSTAHSHRIMDHLCIARLSPWCKKWCPWCSRPLAALPRRRPPQDRFRSWRSRRKSKWRSGGKCGAGGKAWIFVAVQFSLLKFQLAARNAYCTFCVWFFYLKVLWHQFQEIPDASPVLIFLGLRHEWDSH